MGKKYFVSNTLNSQNTLDFKTILKLYIINQHLKNNNLNY